MTKRKLKVLQPKPGEIIEVIDHPARIAQVTREGGLVAFKFEFGNGALLYVPLPAPDDEGVVDLHSTAGLRAS